MDVTPEVNSEAAQFEEEYPDPLNSVAASQVGGDDEESEESVQERRPRKQCVQACPDKSSHVLDASIGRGSYLKDLQEKIDSGSSRLKKRNKTVKKVDTVTISNKLKGDFMELSEYKKDLFGHDAALGGWLMFLRESSFEQQQKTLTGQLAIGGLSFDEIRAKKAAEEAAALKAAQEAAAAKAAAEDEDDDDQPLAKRKKTSGTAVDDGDEIDEESEMLYAQAMQDVSDEEVDPDLAASGQKDQDQDHGGTSATLKRRQPPTSPAAASEPGKRLRLNVPAKVEPGNGAATALSSPTPPTSAAAGHAQEKARPRSRPKPTRSTSTPGAADSTSSSATMEAKQLQPAWGKCVSIQSLNLSQDSELLAVPSVLTKDVQQSKWKAECVKLQPYLLNLEKLLSSTDGTTKVSDQVIKSALTQLKKINTKTDKKLQYETEENGEKLMSVRVAKLRSALEAVKDLRSLVLQGMKTTMDRKSLENAIGKVQQPFRELLQRGSWIGLPQHWAWTTSIISPMLDVTLNDESIQNVMKLIFLPKDLATKGADYEDPSDTTAYGHFMDFYFFCPDAFRNDKATHLQAKWIAQFLFRIINSKGDVDEVRSFLQAMLPEDLTGDDLKSQILSPVMASALLSIHNMIHLINLSEVLENITAQLTTQEMVSFYKPLTRIPTMTQFKKLIHAAHQALSTQQLDQQMTIQVATAKEEFAAFKDVMQQADKSMSEKQLSRLDLVAFMDHILQIKGKLSQLPQSGSSEHHAFVSAACKTLDEDWSLIVFIADLVRAWELLSMLPSFEEKHKQYQQQEKQQDKETVAGEDNKDDQKQGLIALKHASPEKIGKFLENIQARDLTVEELPTSLREELKSVDAK
eukprot:s2866_g3.t1